MQFIQEQGVCIKPQTLTNCNLEQKKMFTYDYDSIIDDIESKVQEREPKKKEREMSKEEYNKLLKLTKKSDALIKQTLDRLLADKQLIQK